MSGALVLLGLALIGLSLSDGIRLIRGVKKREPVVPEALEGTPHATWSDGLEHSTVSVAANRVRCDAGWVDLGVVLDGRDVVIEGQSTTPFARLGTAVTEGTAGSVAGLDAPLAGAPELRWPLVWAPQSTSSAPGPSSPVG